MPFKKKDKVEENKEVEEELPKLSKVQKKGIKYIIKISRKKLKKFEELDEEIDEKKAQKYRRQLIESLIQISEVVDISDEDTGERATEEDFKTMTNEELIGVMEETLALMERLV